MKKDLTLKLTDGVEIFLPDWELEHLRFYDIETCEERVKIEIIAKKSKK